MVKEKLRVEAWRLERHREIVAMRAAVWRVAMDPKVSEEKRPKGVSASIDPGRCKMFFEDAIALVLDLDDLVLNPYQLSAHHGSPV